MSNKEIDVLAMYRNKNKLSFFSIYQFYTKVKSYDPSIDINFHILWDDNQELGGVDTKYEDLINKKFGSIITSYNKTYLNEYCKQYYKISDEQIKLFSNFYLIYRIILGQYLRRVGLLEYFLILDDDILINGDLKEAIPPLIEKNPVFIVETMNSNCDKALYHKLIQLYSPPELFAAKYRQSNPSLYGFNAGFQGVDASIFDDFLSIQSFNKLISLFDYSSTKTADGKELMGPQRFLLDTQEQSFFGILNIANSRKPKAILNPEEYFVIPNWGKHPIFGEINHDDENDGWTFALRSKITHFIGHTFGKGKFTLFSKRVDKYLNENGF